MKKDRCSIQWLHPPGAASHSLARQSAGVRSFGLAARKRGGVTRSRGLAATPPVSA